MVPASRSAEVTDKSTASTQVLLLSGPIHYDFLLPLNEETRQVFSGLAEFDVPVLHPNAHWLVVGWGASGFYTTAGSYSDIRIPVVWRAFTGDSSVMRVEITGMLRPDLPVKQLSLSAQEYSQLLKGVTESFQTNADGKFIHVEGASLTDGDRFFLAHGRFDLFRTCNVWVGRMIHSAGLRFGVWTPVPYSISLSHWQFLSP